MSLYNKTAAIHYAAYRPPLHQIILKKVLSGKNKFSAGLDVGCGTGYSTLALATYCSNVVGIDPSQPMLARATKHPKIEYVKGFGEDIPMPDNSVDIITFAGSLFYMDLKKVASEIRRVCRKDAVIIPYDFEILLDDILASLDIRDEDTDSRYNHTVNFSGQDGFQEIVVRQEQINLEFFGDQLAHLLLSDHHLYKKFSDKYSTERPFEKLKERLIKAGNHFFIKADIYYSMYNIADE